MTVKEVVDHAEAGFAEEGLAGIDIDFAEQIDYGVKANAAKGMTAAEVTDKAKM